MLFGTVLVLSDSCCAVGSRVGLKRITWTSVMSYHYEAIAVLEPRPLYWYCKPCMSMCDNMDGTSLQPSPRCWTCPSIDDNTWTLLFLIAMVVTFNLIIWCAVGVSQWRHLRIMWLTLNWWGSFSPMNTSFSANTGRCWEHSLTLIRWRNFHLNACMEHMVL